MNELERIVELNYVTGQALNIVKDSLETIIEEDRELTDKKFDELNKRVNKSVNMRVNINKFIDEVFDKTGKFKDIEHQPKPSKTSCKYCPFKQKKDLCPKGIS